MNHADAVADERVESFYPSLYLNMGHSHEVLGNITEARRYYDLAASRTGVIPEGRYGDVVQRGVDEGRRRIEEIESGSASGNRTEEQNHEQR